MINSEKKLFWKKIFASDNKWKYISAIIISASRNAFQGKHFSVEVDKSNWITYTVVVLLQAVSQTFAIAVLQDA